MKLLTIVALFGLLAGAAEAAEPNPTVLRWCTGIPTGNYQWAADQIKREMNDSMQISLISTSGSLQNLRKLSDNECDIGFAQRDVVDQYVVENPASHDALVPIKVVYEEYVHILCPSVAGWHTLSEFATAKGHRRLIIGPNGSGTAETWRIIRSTNEKKYGEIEIDRSPVDIDAANVVVTSQDTCMLWVSGLNSNDMLAANALSVRAHNTPMLQLLSIDDNTLVMRKSSDGTPLYKKRSISPNAADVGKPALYDHLIDASRIDVLTVSAVLVMRADYRTALGAKLGRLLRAIGDSQATIWGRVNPAAE